MRVDISRVAGTEDIPLPAYQTEGASGMDLLAAVTEPLILNPNERTAVPTGIMIAIPEGYEAQVRARSGWAKKFGICLTNGIGTIDVDFRGEVHVLLSNLGQEPFTIHRADRIAQLVVTPVMRVQWNVVEELPTTERGVGGFGHTGRQ